MKKTVLITGTSTGVGYATALALAATGRYKVYATMRDLSKSTALASASQEKGLDMNILQLDVQDTASIENCVKTIIEKEGHLDILVNNAGSGFIRSLEQASEAEVQNIFDINLFGTMRCIKAVLPQMRRQNSGHIINISSVGGLVGQPMNEIYCASKFAMEGLSESMATYLQPYFGIHISLVEPAGISTEFVANIMNHIQNTGGLREDAYSPVLNDYMGQRAARAASTQTPDEVAAKIVECIEMPEPPVRMRTSEAAENFCSLKTSADPDGNTLKGLVIEMLLGKKGF